MHRPIPPPRAWQAMLAVAGVFALVSALARPVDLWRISVLSHRGQPLHAVATVESHPDERITDACLSLGPESDAPGSEAPFLDTARLTLNAAGTRVEIRSEQIIHSPTLALVLRVQCPGEMLYARHFGLLIPPAPAAAPPASAVPGFKLKVARGETVESLARLLIPDDRRLREKMVREVLAGNPHAFPDGGAADIAPGTLLLFPDLRILRDLPERQAAPAAVRAKPVQATAAPAASKPAVAKPRPVAPAREAVRVEATAPTEALTPKTDDPPPAAPAADSAPREPVTAQPSMPQAVAPRPSTSTPSIPKTAAPQVRLQPTLELGANPTPRQCSQAMALCAALADGELEQRARATEQTAATLKLRQESIEQQLDRLERSIQSLQRAVAQPPAAAPARPEIRTVVKTEPMPWYYWLGLLGAILAGALGGFMFGRRRAFSDAVVEEDARLDRMLATAAATIREMETAPVRKSTVATRAIQPAPAPQIPAPQSEAPAPDSAPETQLATPDTIEDLPQPEPGAAVDLELESGPTDKPAGLSNDLLFEMDQALDNTRSMFTDVDRFIALGRTQNAISLLQFQVHKDPKDRDSWIKLMAIYRQEKMDADLAKAAREFKRNFPDENPPVV